MIPSASFHVDLPTGASLLSLSIDVCFLSDLESCLVFHFDRSLRNDTNMKSGAKWGIGLGAGIPAALIFIGLIGFLIKFFMKRCRKKPWHDIRTLPKSFNPGETNGKDHKKLRRTPSEREPLCVASTNNAMDASDGHIAIPIDENDLPPNQRHAEIDRAHDHTLVQIQRDRLNRIKDEENRLRPMIRLNQSENDIQRVIDQAQKEFDDAV